MVEEIQVSAVKSEKTYLGKVSFPSSVPEGLMEFFIIPDDIVQYAKPMGLTNHHVIFLLAVMRGKGAVTASVDPPDLSGKTALSFDQIDTIVRDLIEKNYARLDARLDLYRYWICLAHAKGIRFVEA